ncbi:MAG TPA: RsmB/NOP family class I SAM-dependent RNA methyltransferase [Opitutaceae bacterium]|nr:RsmB/NOP family class I SAM-dependent RNA methyltransferase [Opitutaceae bacterium]
MIARWLDQRERIDGLLDSLPSTLAGSERARCQHLVFGVVRHYGRIDASLARLVAHPPRFSTRAVLFIAGFELIEAVGSAPEEGLVAKIVHHAVEQTKTLASPAEARLVNAVVRKLAVAMATPAPAKPASAEILAEYFSHPAWLVERWLAQFGAESTRQLLEWNQQPAKVYARWRAPAEIPPSFLNKTEWDSFFEVTAGNWRDVEILLKAGKLYLQDPGTRLAIELLDPKPGETVLDLCAAPGGKSLLIADRMKTGRLVAIDLPSPRIDRLKENMAKIEGVEVALVQHDLLTYSGRELRTDHALPEVYDAVLIDVPCSNTGVMRHRADVKWRLQSTDFSKHAAQQLALLHMAARLVRPGGRMVYSTCSIDPQENDGVVKAFFESRAGGPFTLVQSKVNFPWQAGHDGGGTFLLSNTLK